MDQIISRIGHALLMAAGMFWQTGWSLVLGFIISALLQYRLDQPRDDAPGW